MSNSENTPEREVKQGEPLPSVGGAPRLGVGDRVRVRDTIRKGPHECDGGNPGTDISMFGLIGKEFTLERSPDQRWPLYGKSFFWLPEWLETPDGRPLAAQAAPEPASGEGSKDELIRELVEAIEKAQAVLARHLNPEPVIPNMVTIRDLLEILDDRKLVETVRNARAAAEGR